MSTVSFRFGAVPARSSGSVHELTKFTFRIFKKMCQKNYVGLFARERTNGFCPRGQTQTCGVIALEEQRSELQRRSLQGNTRMRRSVAKVCHRTD